jgi:hypothetical protein
MRRCPRQAIKHILGKRLAHTDSDRNFILDACVIAGRHVSLSNKRYGRFQNVLTKVSEM